MSTSGAGARSGAELLAALTERARQDLWCYNLGGRFVGRARGLLVQFGWDRGWSDAERQAVIAALIEARHVDAHDAKTG